MDGIDRVRHERALRVRVLAGDQDAWICLYGESFDALHAFLYHRCGRDLVAVEDTAQECWMTAVRRIRDFDPARGSFSGWLRGIAINVLRNEQRRWIRKRKSERPHEGDTVAGDAAGSALELAEQIAVTLAVLPGRYRDILRAKYEEELSVAEIAIRLGGTVKATESLLSRARAAFRTPISSL